MRVRTIVRAAMLVVLTVVLACSVFIARTGTTATSMYRAGVKSDLRNVALAQFNFYERTGRFASVLTELPNLSPGYGSIVTFSAVTDSSFVAVGTSNKVPGTRCELAYTVGDSTADPTCTWPPKPWWDINIHH